MKVSGEKTVENSKLFDLAQQVIKENGAISAHVEGGYIEGTFRGKKANSYKYCYSSKSFDFCNHTTVSKTYKELHK